MTGEDIPADEPVSRTRARLGLQRVYEVTTDEQSQAQIDALPAVALAPFAEARTALELAPWNGRLYRRRHPNSPMRTLLFGPHGEGKIVYLILEDQRRVDLIVVVWLA